LDNDEAVDLLKIDVEIAALEVLKGASEVLNRTKYVIIELHSPIREEGMKILREYGFVLVDGIGNTFLLKHGS